MEKLRGLVLAGPDPVLDGVVLHKRRVGKLPRRLRMTRLQPRPYHPKNDTEAQEA